MKICHSSILKIFLTIIFTIFFYGCDNSSGPESMFEASDRNSDNFGFPISVNKIVITNPIGFTYLSGNTDTTQVSYVLDRKVSAKTKSLAQTELGKIILAHNINDDTLFCNVVYPFNLNNFYDCTLNLDFHYKKDIEIETPNKGIHTAYLYSDLSTTTDAYETVVNQHTGSLEAHSSEGNITATLILPKSGYCNCYSVSGNIQIKIPTSTSASIHCKTISGIISYTNLNINVIVNSTTELVGYAGNGEGTIYLESNSGEILIEGF